MLILQELKRIDADILILTETNSVINLEPEYSCVSSGLMPFTFVRMLIEM